MTWQTLSVMAGFVVALVITCCRSTSVTTLDDAEKIFAYEVFPLLESKCFACHGDDPDDIKGQLDIRSREDMLKGGESGKPALHPGDPERSPILLAASRLDEDFAMPPKANDSLSQDQLKWLYRWIQGGAPWPDVARRDTLLAAQDWNIDGARTVQTSQARSRSWASRRYQEHDLWAFLPLQPQEVPNLGADHHPVDAFIDAQLQKHKIKSAPRADKRTLIRRASFDLIGLPPTPEQIEAFLQDDRPDAFAHLIDRLLASPHYGEQWARHWLDVVRYADTDGLSNDYMRPNAWRYRDYVIRSFNADKPYDAFIREQVAGDEIDPDDPEMLIATGFLRMGPWEHTGMSVAAETRQRFLDDVTNSIGESFLAVPLRCASCHDHKFDPIPTKDYYRMQSVFATTQFALREAPFLAEENLDGMEEEKNRLEAWLAKTLEQQREITAKEESAARNWFSARGRKYLTKRARAKLPEGQKPPRYYGLTHQDLGYRKLLQKRVQRLNRAKSRFEPMAFSVYSGPSRPVHSARPILMPASMEGPADSTFVLTGGSVYAPEEYVRPGGLSALSTLRAGAQPLQDEFPNEMQGRRLGLAAWLSSENNALTLRTIVNRVWQYHFGKGLAENANNFGATGKKPTHPALLDWLAAKFVEDGWSIKKLHRLIMTSEAYQRASHHSQRDKLQQVDPDNTLLAVFTPRRLEAEELRDAMLLVSGELNLELGGLPVRPEVNQEVALQPRHIMGSIAPAYQPSARPRDRNRRTIYAEKYRNMPDPMLEVFNQPTAELSCERRTTSSVTPQVFNLLNSKNSRDRSVAMAARMRSEATDLEDQIRWGMERAWSRTPSGDEVRWAAEFVRRMEKEHETSSLSEEAYPTEIKREMFEEMTGETFAYTEQLDVYSDYTPDLKPWEVDSLTRALADLALVLFNSNEFIYVY